MIKNKFEKSYTLYLVIIIPVACILMVPSLKQKYMIQESNIGLTPAQKLIFLLFMVLFISFLIHVVSDRILKKNEPKFNNSTRLVLFNFSYCALTIMPILIDNLTKSQLFEKINLVSRVSYLKPIFADLETIINGISCPEVNEIGDTIKCPNESFNIWNYPTVLLTLRSYIVPQDRFMVGMLFIIFFLLIINILLVKKIIEPSFFSLIVLLSPPFLLVINRGNFDLLILSLVLLSGILFTRTNLSFIFSIIVLCLTVWLKFYPLPIFVFLMFLVHGSFKRMFIFIIGCSALFTTMNDLKSLAPLISTDIAGAVGLPTLIARLNGGNFASFNLTLYTFLILVIVLIIMYFIVIDLNRRHLIYKYHDPVFIIPANIFLYNWITSSNYYYRLVFIAVLSLIMLKLATTRSEIVIAVMAVCSLFFSIQTLGLVQNLLITPIVFFIMFVSFSIVRSVIGKALALK